MPINTVTTAIVPASQVKGVSGFDAQGATGTTQAIACWFNSASPANSLVFAAAGGVVNVWRTDLRTTTALTGATRLGYFSQGGDSIVNDLRFEASGNTGYLLVSGNGGNIWCYAINLTSIASISSLNGEALVTISPSTANLTLNSTTLDFNFGGNNTYTPSGLVGQQFKLGAEAYTISSTTTQNLGTGRLTSRSFGMAYVPANATRATDGVYLADRGTCLIINPTTNATITNLNTTAGSITGFQYSECVYAPAFGSRQDLVYFSSPFTNQTIIAIDPNTNTRVNTEQITPTNYGSTSIAIRAMAYVPLSTTTAGLLWLSSASNIIRIIDLATKALTTITATFNAVNYNINQLVYVPAIGATEPRVYAIASNGILIINPANNAILSVITPASLSSSQFDRATYAPSDGTRPHRLYIYSLNDLAIFQVTVVNLTTGALDTTAPGTTNGNMPNSTFGYSTGTGPFGFGSISYIPGSGSRPDLIYGSEGFVETTSIFIVLVASGFLYRGFVLRATFFPGLTTTATSNAPVIFTGPIFYTPRLRIAGSTAAKIVLAGTFFFSRNLTNIFLYRNIDLSSFNGTSNVTVNGTSIAPFTSTVGYYDISTPAAVLTAATTNIAFYYKATNAYILATLGTHQWVIYRLNADTLSSTVASPTTPTIATTFSTNTLSASSLVRDVAFAVVGSDLVVLAVGTSVNLLYRFATTAYDSTSNTAVAASGALIQFPHGQSTTAGRLAAIYHNTSTGQTLLLTANNTDTSIYELNLTSFTGTAAVTLKTISISPSANQYTLQRFHANLRLFGFTAIENSSYDSTTPLNSFLANLSGVLNFGNLNRLSTELTLLSERFTSTPALTKASASAPITLATEVDSYQALNILSTASQFLSLGTDTYSSGEYYPWNYLVTDDTAGTLSDSFTFSSATAGITGNYRITMASGTTTTLSSKGTYNDSFTLLSGATLALSANTTLTTEFILSSGVTVTRAAGSTGQYTLTLQSPAVGLINGDPANITIAAPQASLVASNFANGTRAYAARVQTFTIASTAINTSTDTITLGTDGQNNAAAFATAAPWTQVSFRLASGATLPSTTGGTLVDGGFYYWSGGKLYTSIANIPATPIDFTSQGSGNFTLQAETELFNTVVSGNSGLSQVLSEPTGRLIRLKAAYWAKDNNGLASAGAFFDNRDNLIAWSSTGGVSLGATVGPSNLETVHEAIVSTAQIQSNKYGLLSPADSGDTLTQFSIALEGIGTLQINSNDPDGIELIQNIFLWWCWIRSTQAGIRLASYDTLQAINFTSYQAGRVEVENTNSSLPLNLAGGSVTFPGTISGIAQGSFAINLNADVFGTGATVTTGGISPSATDIRNAVGLTAPNLDNQLTGISTKTGALPASFPANFPDLAITASTGQVTVGTLANNSITAAAIAADAVTEIQAGLATQASVNSIPTTPAPTAAQNAAATWTYTTGDRLLTGSQATEIAKIQGIRDKTDALPSDPADQSELVTLINTRASQASVDTKASQSSVDTVQAGVSAIPVAPLLAANYTAPDNTGIAAIKAKTDNLPSDPADQSLIEDAISALPSAASIADTVWAKPLAGYTTEGTAGKKLSDTATPTNIPPGLSAQQVWEYATRQLTGTQATNLAAIPNIPTNPLLASAYTPPPSAGTIAGAVWDEILSQHLGVGSTGAKLNLASTLTVGDIPAGLTAQQVWEYTGGDRSLSGPQAVNSAAMLGLIQAFVRGRFTINYQTATAIQYNPDGTILQVFDLRDAEGNLANSAQVAVDRVPVFSGGATEPQ